MFAFFPAAIASAACAVWISRRCPKATVRFSRDVFENTVASCFFPERSKELEFRLAINLDLDEKDPFHFILENDAVETPFEYEAAIAKLLAPYRERRTRDRLVVPGWAPPTEQESPGHGDDAGRAQQEAA